MFKMFYVLLFGIAHALNLQDAIALTLQNNPSLNAQAMLLQESRANYKGAQGVFYPTFDLRYNTSKSIQRANTKSKGSLGTDLRFNLFNGFSDVYTLKSAKALMESQEDQFETTKEDVILLVKMAYINVLRQAQNVKIAEQSQALLEEQRRQNAEFYHVGLIQKNDLLKIEVELNNTLQDVLSAKSALNSALKDLERYIKRPIALKDLKEIALKENHFGFDTLREEMLKNHSQLHFMNKVIASKAYLTQSAKGEFFPKINLIGNYTRYSDEHGINGRDGTFDNEVSVQMVVTFNLFNGFSDRFKVESVKFNHLAFVSKRVALIEDLELQLFNALENYNLSKNALKIAKLARTQAEENYRISKNRYQQRIETTKDFLDAEFLLTQARSNVALNYYAMIEFLAQLERITQKQLMVESH